MTYSYARFNLYFAPDMCLLDFRPVTGMSQVILAKGIPRVIRGRGGPCSEPGVLPPAAAPCARGATRMRAGPQGRTEKAMYCREPALSLEGRVSAECPTDSALTGLKNKHRGRIELSSNACETIRAPTPLGSKGRCHAARARPTVPEK
jgi:hypothetical protein